MHSTRAGRFGVAIGALAALTLVGGCRGDAPSGGAAAASPLSMAHYLEGRWPSRPAWSPDGRYVSFLWTDWVQQQLYVAAAAGGPPIQLTEVDGFLGGPTWNSSGSFGEWSPDSRRILFSLDGALHLVSVPEGTLTRLTEPDEGAGSGVFSPDGDRVAFVRSGNVFVMTVATKAARQLTTDGRAGGPVWSPDGRWLATSVAEPATWLTATPAYSGPLITFRRPRPSQRDVLLVAADGGSRRLVEASPDNERVLGWSPDGSRLIVERISIDVKERTLFSCRASSPECDIFYRQRDEKYLASNDQMAAFAPDGRSLILTSDADGWNHLYRVAPDGSDLRQLTSGAFEVSFAGWSHDGQRVHFSSTETGTEQRHLYSLPADGGDRTRLTSGPAVHTTMVVSPTRDELAFVRSDASRLPDLWVVEASAGASPRQLTDSMTPTLSAYGWRAPDIVTFAGQGGLPIKAQLFVPRSLDPGRRFPAIVHVHQAAIYQEVYAGPGPQKDNVLWYGWHQRLADLGYVVLNVDFRGSYGYGRDFRTANHLDVGVGDAADVIEGVEFLKGLGYVDADRLGVYGMSYGGHMVLNLLSKYPQVFRAGINIAGVYDFNLELGPWDVRNAWMYARLGSPEDNPKAYFNASAINFIDDLQAPVMTLQGTNDTNVTPLQSIRLVTDLLAKGKTFEFEVYPGEVHFFGRRTSWTDAFGKMERFFEQHLSPR
jgi:dipeptidyl aminopeptidase/acylaminoacyl peptidase